MFSPVAYQGGTLLESAFDRFFPQPSRSSAGGSFLPAAEISEGEDAIAIALELPGIERDQIAVEFKERVLKVSGEKRSEARKGSLSERAYGAFQRSFLLSEQVDAERITASYTDGVLTLSLPRKAGAQPRKIAIAAANAEANAGGESPAS